MRLLLCLFAVGCTTEAVGSATPALRSERDMVHDQLLASADEPVRPTASETPNAPSRVYFGVPERAPVEPPSESLAVPSDTIAVVVSNAERVVRLDEDRELVSVEVQDVLACGPDALCPRSGASVEYLRRDTTSDFGPRFLEGTKYVLLLRSAGRGREGEHRWALGNARSSYSGIGDDNQVAFARRLVVPELSSRLDFGGSR